MAHLVAGFARTAFGWLDRKRDRRTRRVHVSTIIALSIVALGALPSKAGAAETLDDGVTVRIRSTSIEAGWHTGRIKRDRRHCSMVQLDHPTEQGYTLLALMVVNALQLGHTGQWTAIDARQAIAAEPAHCLVEGTD